MRVHRDIEEYVRTKATAAPEALRIRRDAQQQGRRRSSGSRYASTGRQAGRQACWYMHSPETVKGQVSSETVGGQVS